VSRSKQISAYAIDEDGLPHDGAAPRIEGYRYVLEIQMGGI
jgi:hypothetical protein